MPENCDLKDTNAVFTGVAMVILREKLSVHLKSNRMLGR